MTSEPADRPASARPHVVDRALAVHRLRAAGYPSAEVQRRLQVSKSTVSVLGYLGAALAGMEPESLAEFRSPVVTARTVWALATRARAAERTARRKAAPSDPGTDAGEAPRRQAVVALRAALRDHVLQARLTQNATPIGRRAAPRRAADRSGAARAVGWAHAAWAGDPEAFAQRHLAAIAAAHGHVVERAARAVALTGAEQALAGQVAAAGEGSLHRLRGARWRALAAVARGARTPAEERALTVLAVLTRKLREAHDEVTRLGTAPPAAIAPGEPAATAPLNQLDQVRWEDVEEDLRD